MLDWYEKLSAREAGPTLRFWIEGMIRANGDESTLADLKERLKKTKLRKAQRASYESAARDLTEILGSQG